MADHADEPREMGASRRMLHVNELELQRILLDIHDGPVQHMYAALSQLDLLRRALERSREGVDAEVFQRTDRIRLLLEGGLNEVRSFIGAFRPPEFERRELRLLLEEIVLQHESSTDAEVAIEVDVDLPEAALPVKIALYRILQEGLSNAYRHGGASRVAVRVSHVVRPAGGAIRMTIEDNGAGFDPAAVDDATHFGLRGMRDRVEMIGGSYTLESHPGSGTRVAVEVAAR